jgi:hypothetical protein
MNWKPLVKLLGGLWLLAAPAAAQDDRPRGLQVRALLHDPVRPLTEFFLADAGGGLVKLNLALEGLGEPQVATPVSGTLAIYTSADARPAQNPKEHLAATAQVPAGANRLIMVIAPAPPDTNPPYRMVLLDDSPRAFPPGESRVVNMTPVDFALEVGEHKVGLAAGKITRVPPVTRVNEFNQAQTNFYFRRGETWEPFTERQMQYLDEMRRLFLIYATPGAVQPEVRTVIDHAPARVPGQ